MGLFGNLFDFNKDGRTSMGEELAGLSALGALAGAAMAVDEAAAQDEDMRRIEELVEEINSMAEETGISVDVELEGAEDMTLEELEKKRDEYQDLLDELEANEPEDDSSDAYELWEDKRSALEERIGELEDLISEAEEDKDSDDDEDEDSNDEDLW